jgi:hypothetical protein
MYLSHCYIPRLLLFLYVRYLKLKSSSHWSYYICSSFLTGCPGDSNYKNLVKINFKEILILQKNFCLSFRLPFSYFVHFYSSYAMKRRKRIRDEHSYTVFCICLCCQLTDLCHSLGGLELLVWFPWAFRTPWHVI